ncbi:MAG TPA: hypothetical protein DDZ80_03900 [Cyanobacteria bacterium UBA8803]|nr:hypothetical protein [Cyanobacteria bacterium UBA9273]HBL57707.1 hypothetical protein [Cyanobacteria bacterium UBA8803]
MQNCPRCHQSIHREALTCPHCGTILKAYGHPGITLHRATGDTFLCESCTYHADDSCTFPKRPHAKECTLYQDVSQPQLEANSIYAPRRHFLESVKLWCQRHPALVGLLALIAVSLLLTLMAQK